MSDAEQYKVQLQPEVNAALDAQAKALGHKSGNALATVYLTAFSRIPAARVWSALAALQGYESAHKRTR